MMWLDRLLNRVPPSNPSSERALLIGRGRAGVFVDEDNALHYAGVWACVNVIAKSIAILPWSVYERTLSGRKAMPKFPAAALLHSQPNSEMGPYQFKHQVMTHVLTWGNAYCEIERDNAGRPMWLWPLPPDRVRVGREENGELVYFVTASTGGAIKLRSADVLHIRGLGFDGIVGYSPIRMAAETIGAGIAMERFGASFFGNGANMGGVLVHPAKLSATARENLESSLKKRAGGTNALSWIVTEEGMKPERIGIPPEEAQFLQSRQITILDICRWYGVPPHKVASLDRATWSNIEHQEIEFVTDTIQPWVTQLEEEANIKLFGQRTRGTMYTKFNLGALLRGDMKSRYEAYAIASQNGWMCADDIRELEEMNPIPNGKMYLVPSNMVTRQQMKQGKTLKQAISPAQDDESGDSQQSPNPDAPPEDKLTAALRKQRVLNKARN